MPPCAAEAGRRPETFGEGMEAEESDALLARLYAQAENPEYQCFFRYEAGSLAFWGKCSSSLRVFFRSLMQL